MASPLSIYTLLVYILSLHKAKYNKYLISTSFIIYTIVWEAGEISFKWSCFVSKTHYYEYVMNKTILQEDVKQHDSLYLPQIENEKRIITASEPNASRYYQIYIL